MKINLFNKMMIILIINIIAIEFLYVNVNGIVSVFQQKKK